MTVLSPYDFPGFPADRSHYLIQEAQDVIFELDENGYFVFMNNRGIEVMGYSKQEFKLLKFTDLINPELKDSVKEFYHNQLFYQQQTSYLEFPVMTRDGKEIWIGQHAKLLYTENILSGAMAVGRVITDQYQANLLLKQSEEKYRSIIQNLQFGLIEVDLEERITFINEAMCEITGFTKEELLGKVASEVLANEKTKELIENQHQLRAKKQSSAYEAEIIRKDGSSLYALISGAPSLDSRGVRKGSIGIHVDISKRRKSELELQEIKGKLDQYTKGLESLNEINSDNQLTPDQKMEFGLKIVSEYLGLPIGAITKVEANKLSILKDLQSSDIPIKYLQELPIDSSIGGIAFLKRKLIAIPNLSHSEYKNLETIAKMGIQSVLSMPIYQDEQPYGSILLGGLKEKINGFSNYEIEFFKLFARFTEHFISTQNLEKTIARYNSGLFRFNEISSNSSLSIKDQLSEGLKVITEYLHFQKGEILLSVGDSLLVKSMIIDGQISSQAEEIIPIDLTPSGISFSENRLIAIPDVSQSEFKDCPFMKTRKLQSCIFIPIKVGGEPAGVIALGNENIKKESFTENDLGFFRLFALRVGYLITNQLNEENLQKEKENLQAINQELDKNQQFLSSINQFVTALLDKEDIYSIAWEITENIIEKFGFSDCVIYVLNEETEYLEQLAAYGPNKANARKIINPIQIPYGKGIAGSVALTGIAELIPDTRKDSRYLQDTEHRLSEICVPIIADGKVIGVIDSEHHALNFFTEDHLKTLVTIANLASTRIKNAKAKRFQEKAENELRESENQLRSVINAALDAIITINAKGIITEWNPRASEIFGWTESEVIGRPLTDNIIPSQHRHSHDTGMNHYMSTGVGPALNQRIEITALHKKGKEFPVELTIIPITREGNQSFTAFARDITIEKASRDEIQQSLEKEREVNELKSRFVAMTSHEFRTPLTTIKQNVDLIGYMLESDDPLSETKYGKYFNRINSEIGRVTTLMNDILLLGRIESGMVEMQKTNADLVHLIEDTIQKITQGRPDGRKVSLKVIGVKRNVHLDISLIEQIIDNLISNAMKYSENAPDPEMVISFESLSYILIKIKDHGIGIPLKDQKNLFATFYRATNVRNIQGTGLGLSIVKEFVSMHGGTIKLISDTNQGSEFIVKLPA